MTTIPPASGSTASPDIVRIRAAQLADAHHVSELLTAAFLISPVGDWLIPDPTTRQSVYRRYFRIHVDHALRHGRIDLTHDGDGTAVWLPHPGQAGDPHDYGPRLAAACGPWLRRFELLDEVFTRRHPTTWHHYLAFIGVHPDRQREGIGSTMLADHAAALDQRQIPAYLEASTPTAATSTSGTASTSRPRARSRCPKTDRLSGPCGEHPSPSKPAQPPAKPS